MRIISGQYKGRRFQLPKGFQARPTTDFAKEGLFDILSNRIDFEATSVLDLFAGTGSIGLECLSRGARQVVCIEQSPLHAHFIKSVIQQLDAHDMTVIRGDVYSFLQHPTGHYQLIFADAPYADNRLDELADLIFGANLLDKDGWLVIEHSKRTDFSHHPFFKEMRHYGNVHFSFFRLPE